MLVPAVARNPPALTALKVSLGPNATDVASLAAALRQRPEYWLTASRVSDSTVATAELLQDSNPNGWSSQEQSLLERTFGSVLTRQLSSPRRGVVFAFLDQGFATSIYGFPRPKGVVVFSFTATSAHLAEGTDDIVATFSDAQK